MLYHLLVVRLARISPTEPSARSWSSPIGHRQGRVSLAQPGEEALVVPSTVGDPIVLAAHAVGPVLAR